MTHKEPARIAFLTGYLVKAFPAKCVYTVARNVQELQAIASRLQNLAVQFCNGFQTRDHKHDVQAEERAERSQERLQKKFAKLLAEEFPGVTPFFGGDPRGCVVKIKIPGQPGDGGDRETFAVFK